MLEWTPDSATLISLEVRLLDGWFRLQTPTGQILEEHALPSAATYHEIISTHEVLMPGDMRVGVAFTVADVVTSKVVFQQRDSASDAPGTASEAVRFALPPDKSVVAVGYGWPRSGQPVTFYSTKTWQVLKTLSVPADGPIGVGQIQLSNDGVQLAYTGSHGLLIVDTTSGRVIRRLPVAHPGDFAFSPDGHLLAVAELDAPENSTFTVAHALTVFRVTDGARVTSLQSKAFPDVTSLRWDVKGRFLAFVGNGNTVHLWSPASGPTRELVIQLQSMARSLALSPDGKRMAVGDGEAIRVFGIGG